MGQMHISKSTPLGSRSNDIWIFSLELPEPHCAISKIDALTGNYFQWKELGTKTFYNITMQSHAIIKLFYRLLAMGHHLDEPTY